MLLTKVLLDRTARSSRPLEVIGTYDPIPKKDTYDTSGKLHKDVKLDILRAKYWIGVGAQPTDTVWRLLSMVCHVCSMDTSCWGANGERNRSAYSSPSTALVRQNHQFCHLRRKRLQPVLDDEFSIQSCFINMSVNMASGRRYM